MLAACAGADCPTAAGASATEELSALWLARQIYELGGVEFSSFTLGRSTVESPVYVNPKRLIAVPSALRAAADERGQWRIVADGWDRPRSEGMKNLNTHGR